MSFKDSQYFKKFVDEEINKIITCPKDFCQARIRTIFSRAYYTMFLHCRDEIGLRENKKSSVHKDVQDAIKKEYKMKLIDFHKIRKKMDYNNIDILNDGKTLSDLLSIQRGMNSFLELKKDKLINKL